MVAAAHAAGIKVIVDIVPNHTSDLHPWFAEALASEPGSAARAPLHLPRRHRPGRLRAAVGLDLPLRRPRLDPGARRAVVLPPVRPRAARPELGQPRGPRRLPDHPAVLGRPRRRRLSGSTSRTRWPRTCPSRCAASRRWRTTGRAARRHRPAVRPRRGARDLRASGARSSTPTTRRGPRSPRRTRRRERRALYARPTGLGQAFNFDLLKADYDATEFHDVITFCLNEAAKTGLVVDLGAVQPRRGPARHPLRPAGRAPTCDEWLMTGRQRCRAVDEERRAAPGPGRDRC